MAKQSRLKSARSQIPLIVFLFCFAVLLLGVVLIFLRPAADAARNATPEDKRKLAAYSRLLLCVVLFVFFAGLLMTVRIGRFFFPKPAPKREKTNYPDAWAESANRIQTPPADEESDT